MDQYVTEIHSSINDIHMTCKDIHKRLSKIIDDGDWKCTCHRDSDSLEADIRKLQSHVRSLESKVSISDESRLDDDLKMMMDRLDVLENEFQLQESASGNTFTDRDTEPDGDTYSDSETNTYKNLIHQHNEEFSHQKSQDLQRHTNTVTDNVNTSRTQSLDKNAATRRKDNVKLKGNTENAKRLISNDSEKVGNKSEASSNQNNGEQGKASIKSNIAIKKPNFMKTSQIVGLVTQDVKLVYDGERYWRSRAQSELDIYRRRYQMLEGVHSVICLDISESMANTNAWTESRTFITDYLTGLEKMSKLHGSEIKKEYVTLATFGHLTKIQVGYTDEYKNIERELDEIKLGGPTQMYGGILMALAGAWCSGHRIERLDNCSHIFTKIILVSDGKPTEDDLIAGPDIADSSKIDDTKAKILQEMEEFRKNHTDLFFVPVGKTDENFHRTMAECSGGFVLDYRQGNRFSKRQYLTSRLLDPIGLIAGITIWDSDYDISSEDREDLMSIQTSARRHREDAGGVQISRDVYNETRSKRLPPIGSRVRRGPDWHYRMQDSNGPGTVIGHANNDHLVWVEWDVDEHQNFYRYGGGEYDVLIVDEPRKLLPGEKIAVGCKVVPGKHWKTTDGSVNQGVVIKVKRSKKKAKVRWDNGKRDSYLYDGVEEIKVKVKRDSATRKVCGGNVRAKTRDELTNQGYEIEPPNAMTIEEFATKQNLNKNKNLK